MQNGVMARSNDGRLRAYVAWVPMFRGREEDVRKASTEVPDLRASHYWDGGSVLTQQYRRTLGFNEPAWDIYLLYGAQAKWEGEQPPLPAYWMHQLGTPRRPRVNGPYLDAAVFLEKTRELLTHTPG
jgi:hypothetical protein